MQKRDKVLLGLGGGALVALLTTVASCVPGAGPLTSGGLPERVSYNWDVRPILSQNCFSCHGNSKQETGLRLDLEKVAYDPLPESPGKRAVVPGKPDQSELIQRITSTDVDYRMPPQETHKVLSARDIALLTRWIDQGAKYEQHWAYVKPKSVKPQSNPWGSRVVNPVDSHVFARLKREGLSPSPEADRETLINRVTLDLTGLPPTLADVDAFVANKSKDAYEQLVDRLLASRAYAERQATVWLDVARYADSDGFLFDQTARFQHPYRDWVISAFERNLPYDQFVTWQLAGDKLPNATREQILATSFARAGKRSNEAGIIDEEYRVEYGLERTELVGKAFLGLTVGCAKCHDHKYDVISQRDFYSMYGFFNSLDEGGTAQGGGYGTPMGPTLAWPTPKQNSDLAEAQALTATREAAYQSALAGARNAVVPKVDAIANTPDKLNAFLDESLAADLQAYYPLDSGYRASFASLLVASDGIPVVVAQARKAAVPKHTAASPDNLVAAPPDPDLPRLAGADLDLALLARYASAVPPSTATVPPTLPLPLSADKLLWTPSGIPGGKPAALNNVRFVTGARGQAALLDDSVGMADHAVGFFERTQPFTLDLWVKLRAGDPYTDVDLVYNRFTSPGRDSQGYQLQLQANHLRFSLTHVAPYNRLVIVAKQELPQDRWVHVTATYDGNSRARGARLFVDGSPVETETTHDRLTRSSLPDWRRGPFSSSFGFAWGRLFGKDEFKDGAIDEIKVYTRALTPLEVAYSHDAALIDSNPEATRQQLAEIAAASDTRVIQAWDALRQAREGEQAIESKVYQLMVMDDTLIPRQTHVLNNGLYNMPREEVEPQALPRVFGWDEKLPRNRLGLAQWLLDKDNPLTARVYVNRLWQGHFGLGLVDTVEDFGTQGSNPTHPELLDWLAIEFVRSGWDIRHMHKLIVMSATYRQASTLGPELAEKDPGNLLLARGPRYRMPAEMIRDNALFASGLLIDQTGGDSVFPYQPEGVWNNIGVPGIAYPDKVPDDQMHRRSMYTFVRRNAAYPALTVFDMPDRNVSAVFRRISNTPLQALVLLNDPQYVEAYRKLAERAIREAPATDQQLVTLFRLATRRHPAEAELDAMRRYRQAEIRSLSTAPQDIDKLLKAGVAPIDTTIDPIELAAMTMVTAGVMNSPDAYSIR